MSLVFDKTKYEIKTVTCEGQTLTYRAYEGIPYCETPADPVMQRLSVYVNEEQAKGQLINGYSQENAPIFLPNTVGGYMPGPTEAPGPDTFRPETNASFFALLHGYVVVSPGIRGRGMKNPDGKNIGMAPAHIIDYKAAVRYLKANEGAVPGDVHRIISNGTSAGGAISSLLGASGNHPDYAPYLQDIGAADADDSIFAASCYCPITNLDHADMAYEWEFHDQQDYHKMRLEPPKDGKGAPEFLPEDGTLTPLQMELSKLLKDRFPQYVNSLHLQDSSGTELLLNEDGTGTFREFIEKQIIASAQKELDRLENHGAVDSIVGKKYTFIRHMAPNTSKAPAESGAFTIVNGQVTGMDWDAFVSFRTRMKEATAFDSIDNYTAENELFGSAETDFRHFTSFGQEHDQSYRKTGHASELADAEQVRLMNPMNYIDDPSAVKARHYRIRHGAVDRDTSLAISEMLFLKLQQAEVDAQIAHPWGINHAGDYDLEELFAWIDSICQSE